MKKTSALLLALLMVLSVFTGCGSSAADDKGGEGKEADTTAAAGSAEADASADSDWSYIEGKGEMIVYKPNDRRRLR